MADAAETDLPFYLRGAHAPIFEEVEAVDLPIEGALPPELDGLFLRNGPNPTDGDPGHWFMGDGMLHGIELSGGRAVRYRNRFVQTHRRRGADVRYVDDEVNFDFSASVANTHVIEHAGRILTLVENGFPWEVNRDLETIGCFDFDARLQGPMTAHPKICPRTGEMHFFGYHPIPPFLVYHRVDASGALVESREIEIPRAVMMHDFAITEDFVIFMDLPLCFSPESLVKGGVPFRWSADAGARIGVLRRDAIQGEVTWIEIDPCYVFHSMNAWSEGDRITLDVCRYEELWSDNPDVFEVSRLHRFEIDLGARAVHETALDDLQVEFPRIRESRTGLRNRHGYAVWSEDNDGSMGGGIVRYDLESQSRDVYDGEGREVAGEPVFAPASPEGVGAENDGWLLAYFYDRARAKSDLVVFDATRVAAGPIARVELPQRVPIGFHGSWLPRS